MTNVATMSPSNPESATKGATISETPLLGAEIINVRFPITLMTIIIIPVLINPIDGLTPAINEKAIAPGINDNASRIPTNTLFFKSPFHCVR